MAVGDFQIAQLKPVAGIQLAAGKAGIKKNGREDLALIAMDQGATVAAAFTQNLFCAAPVQLCKKHLSKNNQTRYLLINSGNANAGTGKQGFEAAQATVTKVAELGDCEAEQVLVFSTGVIGQPLPKDKINQVLPELFAQLSPQGWNAAAQAIMTTDTYAKGLSKQFELNGKTITITGIVKGVGMIKPNMATLLAFFATDAQLPPALLQQMLGQALEKSFNSVTVDGDTSTNDSCVLIATGASGCVIDGSDEPMLLSFQQALEEVFVELAKVLIRDGEGATKFVEVRVEQGASEKLCKAIAYKICESPLVKTALFASDPNWGRILAAIGNAGVNIDINLIDVYLNDVCIVRQGALADSYTEEQGQQAMAAEDICIRVDLNAGEANAQVWTIDFSYDYVKINAEYRT